MTCKFEHEKVCYNRGSPLYLNQCRPKLCASGVKMTNADRIRYMSDEDLAEFLSSIAYGRETPWSKPFKEKFCKACPVTKVEIPDYLNPLFLHECDFTDGKCPHGSEIVWWLQQPAEEEKA